MQNKIWNAEEINPKSEIQQHIQCHTYTLSCTLGALSLHWPLQKTFNTVEFKSRMCCYDFISEELSRFHTQRTCVSWPEFCQYFDEEWVVKVENDFETVKLLTVCSKIWERGELLVKFDRVSTQFENCHHFLRILKKWSGLQVLTQDRKKPSICKKWHVVLTFDSEAIFLCHRCKLQTFQTEQQ